MITTPIVKVTKGKASFFLLNVKGFQWPVKAAEI